MNFFKRSLQWIKPLSLINVFFYFLICTLLIALSLLLFPFFSASTPVVPSGVNLQEKSSAKDYWVILGFLAAAITLTYNIRRHLSEDYYKEAKSQLEKSYLCLCNNPSQKITNDRLKWLTTARLLLSAERISNKIIMSSHKYIYKEDKQYWRIRFVEIIEDFPEDFYQGHADGVVTDFENMHEKISLASIYAIHKFMQWDDSYIDPLEKQLLSKDQRTYISRRYPILRRIIDKAEKNN